MGITEDRNQKQIHFCFVCNGPGISAFKFTERDYAVDAGIVEAYGKFSDKDRRICPACLRKLCITCRRRAPVRIDSTRKKKKQIPPLPTPRIGSWRYFTWHNQNGICHYCKQLTGGERWTVDHRHPKSKGGKQNHNNKFNLVGCCQSCNHLKGSLTEQEFLEYFSKSKWMHI